MTVCAATGRSPSGVVIPHPVTRNELYAASPSVSDRGLEPAFWQISVVADDHLQSRGEFSHDVAHQLEHRSDSEPVGVIFREPALVVSVRWVVRLGWLIEHQEPRNRTVLQGQEPVEGQVCGQVVADPVGGASDAEQRCRAVGVSVTTVNRARSRRTLSLLCSRLRRVA